MQEELLMQKQDYDNKRVLFIIAQNNFRDEELKEPKEILENAGFTVDVASIKKEEAIGMFGMSIMPDIAVKDAKIEDYKALVVVGGSGSPSLLRYDEVLRIIGQATLNNLVIGGICLGPMILAKAGILKGKKVTVFETPNSLDALADGGAEYSGNDIEVDGNIVTANGPEVAREFGEKLLELLEK